jgi:adenosylmethionine-8-amino-7-oxononanoate aminotransferase
MTSHYWHPFADMHRVSGRELIFRRGEGCWIEDVDGVGAQVAAHR